jgi:hypothetical protein
LVIVRSLAYAPVSLSSLGEKLGTDPWIGQPTCWDCVGSPFSWEQWDLSKYIGALRKVVTYGDHPQEAYAGRTWTDVGSIHVVLVGFSPVGCTSIRIAVTPGYE